VTRHAVTDVPVEPGIGHAGPPQIKGRVQPPPLIGAQPVPGATHVLATLCDNSLTAFAAFRRVPIAPASGFRCTALLFGGAILDCALALGRAGTLGITFTLRVAALPGPLDRPVLLTLRRALALPVRLLRLRLAGAVNARGSLNAGTPLGLAA
jgi:hypothetical protein